MALSSRLRPHRRVQIEPREWLFGALWSRGIASRRGFFWPVLALALLVSCAFGERLAVAQPAAPPPAAPAAAPPAAAPPAAAPPAAAGPGPSALPSSPATGGPGAPEAGLPAAPPTDAELARGQTIIEVAVAGNQRIPVEDIQGYLQSLRAGQTFTPEGMQRDIREVWRSLYFEDVQVDLERRDAGVKLRVLVRERPKIGRAHV